MTTTDSAALALGMSVIAALAAIVTGDALISTLTIAASALRLALAYRQRQRPANVYRAHAAAQRTRVARMMFHLTYRPDPSGFGFTPRTRLTGLAYRAMLAPHINTHWR